MINRIRIMKRRKRMKKIAFSLLAVMLAAILVVACAPRPPEEVDIEMLTTPGISLFLFQMLLLPVARHVCKTQRFSMLKPVMAG